MRMKQYAPAAILITAGLFFSIAGSDLAWGSLSNIGPGFFPRATSATLLGMGILTAFRPDPVMTLPVRKMLKPLVLILLSVATYGLMIDRVGLFPSVFVSMLIASMSSSGNSLVRQAVLATVIAISAWILFSYVLGLPLLFARWPL